MKKYLAVFAFAFLLNGCITGSIDYSTKDIYNESAARTMVSWLIQYDTINGRILKSDLLGGATETRYPDSTVPEELLDDPPKIAEARGQKLAEMIHTGMTTKVSDKGEGIIKISRPFFKDKFILHTKISLFDNSNFKIAELDVFNKCDYDGKNTTMANDAMHDYDFARYCAAKIYEVIGR
ncbi:MAG: hypothetical protein LWX07_01040 [Bacteroidetes bacterium]|nr:hypothetical protein [Bacteroidota bacterium]